MYIISGPTNQRVRAGKDVTFKCTAGTDSRLHGVPTIDWHKDYEKINFNRDHRFRKDEVNSNLFMKNASTSDTGIYSCVAKLGQDRDKAEAELIVEGQCNVVLLWCASWLILAVLLGWHT